MVVYDNVDGKYNLEEKTREVADNRMSNFDWNFLQLGFNMLGSYWLTRKFCMFSTCATALRSCVLVVDIKVARTTRRRRS